MVGMLLTLMGQLKVIRDRLEVEVSFEINMVPLSQPSMLTSDTAVRSGRGQGIKKGA